MESKAKSLLGVPSSLRKAERLVERMTIFSRETYTVWGIWNDPFHVRVAHHLPS